MARQISKHVTMWISRAREFFSLIASRLLAKRKVTQKHKHDPDSFTLKDLLTGLEDTHESISRQLISYNSPSTDQCVALRKLGPLVPLHDIVATEVEKENHIKLLKDENLPALVALGWREYFSKENKEANIALILAIRHDKTPSFIRKRPGVCYEFAVGWKFVNDDSPQLVWEHAAIHVNNCRAEVSEMLHYHWRTVGQHGYTVKEWIRATPQAWGLKDNAPRDTISRLVEGALIKYQLATENDWMVHAIRNGQRVRFSIPIGRQKTFFRDRLKLRTTRTGRRKPILHIVTEHTRNYGGKVRVIPQHIRGERHFFWQDFECHIFAPLFHDDISLTPVGAHYVEDEELQDTNLKKYVDLTRVAKFFADMQTGKITKDEFYKG